MKPGARRGGGGRQGRHEEARTLLEETIADVGGLEGDAVVANSQLAIALAAHLASTGRTADARAFFEPIAARIAAAAGERHAATRSVNRFLDTLGTAPAATP